MSYYSYYFVDTVTIGDREEIIINIGNLIPLKNGIEVIVEEANGSKYMIPFERDHHSTIYKGFIILELAFYPADAVLLSCDNVLILFPGFWIAKNIGKTNFAVFFDENLVCESQIIVCRNQDATMCRVSGDGLKRAVVGEAAKFQVDMKV